nr:protein LTV1 [Hymenolepis microstoma]
MWTEVVSYTHQIDFVLIDRIARFSQPPSAILLAHVFVVMTSNSPNNGTRSGTKRTAEDAFGQKLMTDVPEHFNYGVFYDDDYNYMKHMKTMKEFIEDENYAIVGDEEDAVLPENYVPPIAEPVVEDDPVDEELEICSDDELIAEVGELPDNFVELAGGKHVRLSDEEEDEGPAHELKQNNNPEVDLPSPSTSYLPLHKIKMMERYLYGSELPEVLECPAGSSNDAIANATARKGRSLTDLEELLEKKFDNLLRQTKSRSGYDGLSMVTGTSVMSDSLQTVVDADRIMISKKVPTPEDWHCFDSQVKAATLQSVQEMDEQEVDEDPLKDWMVKAKPTDSILTVQQNESVREILKQPGMLVMPKQQTNGKATKKSEPLFSNQSDGCSDSDEYESQNNDTNPQRRVRGETAEEKRARKAAIKARKRERQQARKMNKLNFRQEKLASAKVGGKTIVD